MLEHAAPGGISRRFADQRSREHPGALDPRQVALVRHAPHVADASFGVAAAEADDLREQPGPRARAREAVLVHAQSEVTVRAGGVGGEDAAVDVAHPLRILRGAERVAVLFALARPIAQRGRQPKIRRPGHPGRPGRIARAREREPQEGIDALQLEVGRIERRGPPDVGTRLEDEGRGITRMARGQGGEIRGGALEAPAIQRVEADSQRAPAGICYGRPLMKHQYDRGEQLHVSGERR